MSEITHTSEPLVILFLVGRGEPKTNLASERADHISKLTKCKVFTQVSDHATPLIFDIKQNGMSIFTVHQTIAAGTPPGTATTITALTSTPLNVAEGDLFSIDVLSGSPLWAFTVLLAT